MRYEVNAVWIYINILSVSLYIVHCKPYAYAILLWYEVNTIEVRINILSVSLDIGLLDYCGFLCYKVKRLRHDIMK